MPPILHLCSPSLQPSPTSSPTSSTEQPRQPTCPHSQAALFPDDNSNVLSCMLTSPSSANSMSLPHQEDASSMPPLQNSHPHFHKWHLPHSNTLPHQPTIGRFPLRGHPKLMGAPVGSPHFARDFCELQLLSSTQRPSPTQCLTLKLISVSLPHVPSTSYPTSWVTTSCARLQITSCQPTSLPCSHPTLPPTHPLQHFQQPTITLIGSLTMSPTSEQCINHFRNCTSTNSRRHCLASTPATPPTC